jgi:hypothetical protein
MNHNQYRALLPRSKCKPTVFRLSHRACALVGVVVAVAVVVLAQS